MVDLKQILSTLIDLVRYSPALFTAMKIGFDWTIKLTDDGIGNERLMNFNRMNRGILGDMVTFVAGEYWQPLWRGWSSHLKINYVLTPSPPLHGHRGKVEVSACYHHDSRGHHYKRMLMTAKHRSPAVVGRIAWIWIWQIKWHQLL